MVNSFIHVIMYAYYTMPIIGVKVPLFLKKSITNCQKLQFCICLVHAVYVSFKGNCPLVLPATQAFVMINMRVLFTQFSTKAYAKKKQKEEVEIKMLKPTSSEDELSCPARLD
jgi:elongation of very long chain fatty acids protein 4